MENYVIAAAWYILGMVLYFVFELFIRRNVKYYVDLAHKEVPWVPFSDRVIAAIIVVVVLLSSFVWPITAGFDFVKTLKGEID